MFRKQILFLYCVCFTGLLSAGESIYVSPYGKDSSPGSKSQPVQTLEQALSLSRSLHVKMICLRGGSYYDVGIMLTPQDSGLTITGYKGEKATLYGGTKVSSFVHEGNFLVASLPASKQGWDFRMLLVDGALAMRSRLPETGYFQYENKWNVKALPALYGAWGRKPTKDELLRLYYRPQDFGMWRSDAGDAEIAMQHQWKESYTGVAEIDTIQKFLVLTEPATMPLGSYNRNEYVVWNTKHGITHPGQWYWDKAGNKVYYLLEAGEVVREMIIPSRRNIITLQKNTKNIVLRDFKVSVSACQLRNEEFACVNVDAAITGDQLSNIRLDGMTVVNVGGNGIRLKGRDIVFNNVSAINCGGGGIYFTGRRIQINDSRIENMGTIFSGAVGIQGNATNVLIAHCSIANTPYSGICLASDSARIEYCSIKKSMTVMRDGAAIYCGGHIKVDVKNNYIEGNRDERFTMGIYFDELSQNCEAANNIVVNSGIPVHCHLSQNIVYSNNLFIDRGRQQINYGGSSGVQLNGNVFIADTIACNGPSVFDKIVDTLTIESKLRRYANPTGVSSFKNNYIFTLSAGNGKLPRVSEEAVSGTKVKYMRQNDIATVVAGLLNNKEVSTHVDLSKMGLTSARLKDVSRLVSESKSGSMTKGRSDRANK
jgi:Right handed beta helix region